MRNLALVIVLLFNLSLASAQRVDSIVSKAAKTKNVDGTIMSPANDLITNLSASPQFTTLVKLINAAGLSDNLKTGTVTFFAPTDKAFGKLAPGVLDTLLSPAHQADLVTLLSYYTLPIKITSRDIDRQIKAGNGQATFTTVSGGILTARINENRNIVLTDENGNTCIVTKLNIEQGNGILFIVDNALLPKPKQ